MRLATDFVLPDGQLSFLPLNDYPAAEPGPLAPEEHCEPGSRVLVRREWSDQSALCVFLAFLVRCDYDEQATYNRLLDHGCPVDLADAAWKTATAVCL